MAIPFPKDRALQYSASIEAATFGLLVARDGEGGEHLFHSLEPSPLITLFNAAVAASMTPSSYVEFIGGEERPYQGGEALAEMLELDYLYVDGEIAVINKEPALLAVPGRGEEKSESVTTRLKRHFPVTLANPAVHRLDYDTSGLMVLALTQNALSKLSLQFSKRLVYKRYVALLEGSLEKEEGATQLAFRYDPHNKPCQIYDPVLGKWGETRWKKIGEERFQERVVTRVELFPLTGRTHQLRLHTSHPKGIGIPIVGDRLYGDGRDAPRLMLHATTLGFKHPSTGEYLEFQAPEMF